MAEEQSPQVLKFDKLCREELKLFSYKNKAYGNAFEIYGVLGVVCEILGAVNRLPQLVLWSPDHGKSAKDNIRDILMDLHNFANMAIMCLDNNNWDGR